MIGILPAAGKAERIHCLPKMLLPIPGGYLLQRHIEALWSAHANVYVMGNPSNTKLLQGYTAHAFEAECYATMTETVLSARQYTLDSSVLFGMPDTYLEDADAYAKITDELDRGGDVVAGLFYTRPEQRHKLGMCYHQNGRLLDVTDKPEATRLEWAWGVLAWRPVFWQYLDPADPHVGYALPRAIADGLDVRAVTMRGGYWDCGTYEEFACLTRYLHS